MKIIIVGYGRLALGLAVELSQQGEDVTVISSTPEFSKQLGENFTGEVIEGVEFDKDILEKAGIKRTDSLIACTRSDETNALVSRIARNYYKVPKVIARLYDRGKVDIYNALGIQVIATTQWGIARTKELLTFNTIESVMSIGGNSPVEIIRIAVPSILVGRTIREVFPMEDVRIVAISRENQSFIPSDSQVLEEQDIVYLSVLSDSLDNVTRALDL